MNKEFTTKEEYLAFRLEWRATYATLTLKQREAKRDARTYDSINYNNHKYDKAMVEALQKKYGFKYLQYNWNEIKGHVYGNRLLAVELLEMRKASKLRCQEQYLLAKEKGAN